MQKILRSLAFTALLAPALFAGTGIRLRQSRVFGSQSEPQTEKQIVREVRHVLVMLPYYTVFDNLAYKVQGDSVTLEGQVVRPALKSDAEAAVKRVQGVGSVVNHIQVLPVSPMDTQIRHAVYRAIYGEAALAKYGYQAVPAIHIIVRLGSVTLEGLVDSQADRNLAGLRANQVPSVFAVQNNLRIENRGD